MIIKSFELNKIDLVKHKIILFYGNNDGLKSSSIKKLFKNKEQMINYDEKEILENSVTFLDEVFTSSLFENEKYIIINRATDKILKIMEEIDSKNIEDLNIIINSGNLEKNSKLRNFFEKNKKYICVPFYPDNNQTLLKLAVYEFKQRNINISQSNINQIIDVAGGDRKNLFNEIQKIEYFTKNGKKISENNLAKLINLSENFSVNELIDNYLANNIKKTKKILNENIFTNEDCILIARTFLIKSKKLLKLTTQYEKNNNIELTISSSKPPIFWKDKEITKNQIKKWSSKNLKILIYNLAEIELVIKKNLNSSLNIISDFLMRKT